LPASRTTTRLAGKFGAVMFDFFEFFAGGGMVRAGLGSAKWRCRFANDFDHKKSVVYRRNWGDGILKTADVRTLATKDMPGDVDLVWASFPCQDLSLAGGGAGLKGDRSGTFWPFWSLMKDLIAEGRPPRIIALENVCGTLTSHEGKDFAAICSTFERAGYVFGAVVIDAALFVPQSRPRLFMIGIRSDVEIPAALTESAASPLWHTRALRTALDNTPVQVRENWVWWSLPEPARRNTTFADLVEDDPSDVEWHTPVETRRLLGMMSDVNRAKLHAAKGAKRRLVGAVYKRTRLDEAGRKIQRAEIRFDDVAGCLRTPAGGSSRQTIMLIEGKTVRSRLLSPREAARLMGLPEEYVLPNNYNEAYHLAGDGVAVPVVSFLATNIFEPILASALAAQKAA
jgi:DNA (cytosine-5)-methyltransferase 1